MKLFKPKRGATLIETLIALSLMSMAIVLMAKLTELRISDQQGLDSQYVISQVDAFMSDLYTEYHQARYVDVDQDEDTGVITLVLDLGAYGSSIYEYVPDEKGAMYHNGAKIFNCKGFSISVSNLLMEVTVNLEHEKQLYMKVYK